MKTLQQIVKDHKSLDELMIESGGELTDLQQEEIVEAWITEIKSDLSNKVDGYKYRQDTLENASDALKARAKLMSSAAKVLSDMSDSLKERMKSVMLELQMNEISGNDFKFKLSNSKPSLEIINEELIDRSYFIPRTVYDLDKETLKKDIENGVDIEGVQLRPGTTLRITANKKVKEIC